ncbi:DUF2786 domain-containing protein [Streptomyces scabiei]|uniref:DUF2786 domain-containing protein n=1 Tax=Streptomyces scabiei TaxID=1930 RepID=UPI0006917DED|nr:DUF2786 domain-containing protein [Streptomyces scabiei]MBP5908862.1 DUF2786 domain-containing protein [Streptomyces sp. LBUM 1478]MBP5927552.1 DUF2786 domain-containing protein [Streptomyces sp. LBUM 1479]MDX2532510.1 DUF2786 domain-containing protein [Streptomyces scabiei]MDX2794814.1 DUF2786 domain-containing protein [Streptomyces scabiei]MDX2832167.1 DUF2786 domain-containing protein [Streptomyces scabiei]
MTVSGTDGLSEKKFRQRRAHWLEIRAGNLANVLETAGPRLYRLLPSDLGDLTLVAAVTVARLAADEARAQPVGDSVRWLERLIPGGHLHELESAVRELRSRLAASGEPALWSWNAQGWEEMLLWWWRRSQPATDNLSHARAGWRVRWSADIPGVGDVDCPEWAPRRHGRHLLTPTEFFAAEPEPLRLLAQAVLDAPGTAAAVQDAVLLREEHLQSAWHLMWLAEQQAGVEQLEAWRRRHQATGSEATRAFLAELSEAVKRYMSLVLQPVVDALSACERALLGDSRHGARRSAADYLDAFLDAQEQPGEEGWRDERLSEDVQQQARARHLLGETTWHGMLGTVPVWYRIVTSREERAAALAFSGKPSTPVVRVRTGAGLQRNLLSDLFGPPADEHEEWYPEPGIEIDYAPDSAFDLCALLAVSQLGHARLEFLIRDADGSFQRLRSVRARVREDETAAWRRWALGELSALVPDPEDLADLIAREDDDGADEDDAADARTRADDRTSSGSGTSGSDARPARDGLPEALLNKVRALLLKAENPAATADEARAYLDKAYELMAKYGIEQAMLDADVTEAERPVDRIVDLHPPYVKEGRRLLARIGYEMRCRSVYPGGKDNRHRVHLFGFETDIQATEVLFASLRLQMLEGADRADRLHRPETEDARAYKRSWMLGFIREVTARIGAAQQAARAAAEEEAGADEEGVSGRSVALVLADRTTFVEARLAAQYPKLNTTRPTKFKGTGYWQGVADGRHADIGGSALADEEPNVQLTR